LNETLQMHAEACAVRASRVVPPSARTALTARDGATPSGDALQTNCRALAWAALWARARSDAAVRTKVLGGCPQRQELARDFLLQHALRPSECDAGRRALDRR